MTVGHVTSDAVDRFGAHYGFKNGAKVNLLRIDLH